MTIMKKERLNSTRTELISVLKIKKLYDLAEIN